MNFCRTFERTLRSVADDFLETSSVYRLKEDLRRIQEEKDALQKPGDSPSLAELKAAVRNGKVRDQVTPSSAGRWDHILAEPFFFNRHAKEAWKHR
mmetsp:Transcript_6258/g.16291  ORF Transcript_6258/g.16291 Transcript_6258/m.16291 type:complete len:96 (-) Transcript_6258:149-436(-)